MKKTSERAGKGILITVLSVIAALTLLMSGCSAEDKKADNTEPDSIPAFAQTENESIPDENNDGADMSLSDDELIGLYKKACKLYTGWCENAFSAELEFYKQYDNGTNVFAEVRDTDMTVDRLYAEFDEVFTENVYKEYLDGCYIMHNGKLYGVLGCGEGYADRETGIVITIKSRTADKCTFDATSVYDSKHIEDFTESVEMQLIDGKWKFTTRVFSAGVLYDTVKEYKIAK